MTWTTPSTQIAGTLITEAMYNDQIIDNIIDLRQNKLYAHETTARTSQTTITGTTWTTVDDATATIPANTLGLNATAMLHFGFTANAASTTTVEFRLAINSTIAVIFNYNGSGFDVLGSTNTQLVGGLYLVGKAGTDNVLSSGWMITDGNQNEIDTSISAVNEDETLDITLTMQARFGGSGTGDWVSCSAFNLYTLQTI